MTMHYSRCHRSCALYQVLLRMLMQKKTLVVTMKGRVEIFDTTCRRRNKAVSIKLLHLFSPVHLQTFAVII